MALVLEPKFVQGMKEYNLDQWSNNKEKCLRVRWPTAFGDQNESLVCDLYNKIYDPSAPHEQFKPAIKEMNRMIYTEFEAIEKAGGSVEGSVERSRRQLAKAENDASKSKASGGASKIKGKGFIGYKQKLQTMGKLPGKGST